MTGHLATLIKRKILKCLKLQELEVVKLTTQLGRKVVKRLLFVTFYISMFLKISSSSPFLVHSTHDYSL